MIEVKVPELAESITEGTIVRWLVDVGNKVNQGDDIAEIETDKVNIQISAEHSGVLKKIEKGVDDTVEVGEVIALLDENEGSGTEQQAADSSGPQSAEKQAPAERPAPAKEQEPVREAGAADLRPASPAARKLAREKGIDLNSVQTSDPLGRVRLDDVTRQSASGNEVRQPAGQPLPLAVDPAKPVERVKMSRRRQTIADRLVSVQHEAAMLTTFNEVDLTAIMKIRKRRKETFVKEHDVKLGFMSFFTKAVVGALKSFPLLNAEIDGTDILVKKYYDIGIAVATDQGLVVPVVREADRLTFAEIEQSIKDLAAKARTNRLQLGDLQGGTFTITNGGTFGSLMSTPIINAPQVGILGMHGIKKRPVAVETPEGDKIEIRPMMYIALSYDHRIVDGSEAVQFLVKVKTLLEDPETLLLEG
ncbi:2-oxoglutarate dehydrogenase complex dihydrolipoyllysine-residue succinyltransferase [Sporolactobacillus putidus]|uniref:Dihydrolipoyllysine-residue succinyltransferase component of 2-oxoglutarate dehydrogenase complex n=1 Tax=Sporolactobacillus putidus TaxID=492735 RepID=A0A917RYN2_9BACL|nr:2-oxoglutarate dehydrogenase complex dihydrolipoyllysine-residue succinyltransferase [Sporolactobacillus putidus]GGL43367.1 dihydrolipoyllysine-residue succinyltransferase component of 2-oxoglutarate dehydrogenase complex [Sporolactobacillus putidus]